MKHTKIKEVVGLLLDDLLILVYVMMLFQLPRLKG
jgi:hypothetical protein